MEKTKTLTRMALLTAIALIIFIIELRLPNLAPIPGVKLGLANIVTVYAMFRFTRRQTLMILTARILLGSIFAGNMMALLYSAAGGLLCFCVMALLKKRISVNNIWACSVIGAIAHNAGQMITAIAVTQTIETAVYFPVLVLSGCIAGAFTGVAAQLLVKAMIKAGK
jgi:heptaprenyl diphosphate synthase